MLKTEIAYDMIKSDADELGSMEKGQEKDPINFHYEKQKCKMEVAFIIYTF